MENYVACEFGEEKSGLALANHDCSPEVNLDIVQILERQRRFDVVDCAL